MPLEQTSRALNLEPPCHYCHSGCLSCKHKLNALPPPPITGYHPECHTPTIEPEADSDSWICRQCVFAVSTKVRLLISPSHTPGGGGVVEEGGGDIRRVIWEESSQIYQTLLPLYCCVQQKIGLYEAKSPPPPVSSSVLDVLHCVRGNHEESIVMKLKNYAEVERKYV